MAILPTDRITRKNPTDSAPLDQDSGLTKAKTKEIKLNKAGDELINDPSLPAMRESIASKVEKFIERKMFDEIVEGLSWLHDEIIQEQESVLSEESAPYYNKHIAAHAGKNYSEIVKHYGNDKTKEHIANLTKERDELMAKHKTIKAGFAHDRAIRGLKDGMKQVAEAADPSSYLRQATQARLRGQIQKASIYTRIAAAIRRGDQSTAQELRRNLASLNEQVVDKAKKFVESR